MTMFGWAMLALGLFLVLYTVAFMVRPKAGGSKDKIGCGFVLLAGLVWSIALTQYLDSSSAGVRLGFGIALILPALAALFRGGRNRIIPAAICFIVAILIASSALPLLKERAFPTQSKVEALTASKRLETLRLQIQKRESHLNALRAADSRLKAELKALQIADFEAAMADPEAKRVIEELAEVKRLWAAAEPKLDAERAALKKLESDQRRAQRRAQGDALARQGEDIDGLSEAMTEDDITSPATVEDYAEREAMRDIFETIDE